MCHNAKFAHFTTNNLPKGDTMKTTNLFLSLFFVFCSACGTMYTSTGQYRTGNFYGVATGHQVADEIAERMAIEKLEAQPAHVGIYRNGRLVEAEVRNPSAKNVMAGFKGVVANMSDYRNLKFEINGPEQKSYYLLKGQRVYDFLESGMYIVTVYYGGEIVGTPQKMRVSEKIKVFQGESVHWFAYSEW